jgi:hypothetical protein
MSNEMRGISDEVRLSELIATYSLLVTARYLMARYYPPRS